jgi:ABC-type branched-subunit amino acid transport system substrate-binding protein
MQVEGTSMTRTLPRAVALGLLISLGVASVASCSDTGSTSGATGDSAVGANQAVDYKAIGLWDDGPCDKARKPLVVGIMTVFESPGLSLGDQVRTLQAAAQGFNNRGGANGACIQVVGCDDKSTLDQSVACVRQIDSAGVVATVNDTGTAGQAEVSAAMSAAKIPRIATNVSPSDWGDPNAFPIDASGTGGVFLGPQALVSEGVKDIAIVRVDQAAASAMLGFLQSLYPDATFPRDMPVPGGTTDFAQFILAAQGADAKGITLAVDPQAAIQIIRAAQQLNSTLVIGSPAFNHADLSQIGDYAKQLRMLSPFPPATVDLPVYKALRSDVSAADDQTIDPEHISINAMRSWIGLYALLRMIRDSGMKDFTRDGITTMLQNAKDVPMLDMFGGQSWTPNLDHPGVFKRAGMDGTKSYTWDPDDHSAGFDGNYKETATISFDKTLCGSPLGAPKPC